MLLEVNFAVPSHHDVYFQPNSFHQILTFSSGSLLFFLSLTPTQTHIKIPIWLFQFSCWVDLKLFRLTFAWCVHSFFYFSVIISDKNQWKFDWKYLKITNFGFEGARGATNLIKIKIKVKKKRIVIKVLC